MLDATTLVVGDVLSMFMMFMTSLLVMAKEMKEEFEEMLKVSIGA